jgi:hypothetical protein
MQLRDPEAAEGEAGGSHIVQKDYTRMQKKESLRVTLPTSSRDGSA